MMKVVLYTIGFLFMFLACNEEAENEYKEIDLIEYGVPVTIRAPQDAEVKKGDMSIMTDITVKGGDNYDLQIFSTDDAFSTNPSEVKELAKESVMERPNFSQIVTEDEQGFIYKMQRDSLFNYGFNYFKIKGSKEIKFQSGFTGTFNEEEVRRMYESVK